MASKLTVRNLHISWCAWLRRPKRSLKFFQRSQNTVQTRCITTTIGVGAGKFLGVRSIFARISPNLPEKILRAHFLQNVVNRGDLRLCGGDWHSNLTKISLIYSISYFNLGAWNFVWEGYAHQSPPPVATGLIFSHKEHEDLFLVRPPKKGPNCVFLQTLDAIFWSQTTLGAIFALIFRDFTQVFRGFAQIFRDFPQIFSKSKLLGLHQHPCLSTLLTTTKIH